MNKCRNQLFLGYEATQNLTLQLLGFSVHENVKYFNFGFISVFPLHYFFIITIIS
jgi:hypothetical protein